MDLNVEHLITTDKKREIQIKYLSVDYNAYESSYHEPSASGTQRYVKNTCEKLKRSLSFPLQIISNLKNFQHLPKNYQW